MSDVTIFDIYRPLERTFSIFGVNCANRAPESNSNQGQCKTRLKLVYCILIIILAWIDLGRYFVLFKDGFEISSSVLSGISIILYSLSQNWTQVFAAVFIRKYYCSYLDKMHVYWTDYGSNINNTKFKRVVWFLTILLYMYFVSVLLLILFNGLNPIQDNNTLQQLSKIGLADFLDGLALMICVCALLLIRVIVIGVYIFMAFLYYLSAFCMYRALSAIASDIHSFRNMESKPLSTSLYKLRKRHEALCDIVESMSGVLCHFVFSCYSVQLPTTCFFLYASIYGRLDNADVYVSAVNVVMGIVFIIATTIAGAVINRKAHAPYNDVMKISLKELSDEDHREVSYFLTRLSGPSIGIDVYGLFVIDSSTILMLTGTVLTYVIIVLQLKPSDVTCPDCVCSGHLENTTSTGV